MVFEGKEMIFFTKEDKEQLLGHFKRLRLTYQNKFGDFNDRFDEEIEFWDGFFESELKGHTLVFGNSNDESLKRTALPLYNIKEVEWLKEREAATTCQEQCYNYRDAYPFFHLDTPNLVGNSSYWGC